MPTFPAGSQKTARVTLRNPLSGSMSYSVQIILSLGAQEVASSWSGVTLGAGQTGTTPVSLMMPSTLGVYIVGVDVKIISSGDVIRFTASETVTIEQVVPATPGISFSWVDPPPYVSGGSYMAKLLIQNKSTVQKSYHAKLTVANSGFTSEGIVQFVQPNQTGEITLGVYLGAIGAQQISVDLYDYVSYTQETFIGTYNVGTVNVEQRVTTLATWNLYARNKPPGLLTWSNGGWANMYGGYEGQKVSIDSPAPMTAYNTAYISVSLGQPLPGRGVTMFQIAFSPIDGGEYIVDFGNMGFYDRKTGAKIKDIGLGIGWQNSSPGISQLKITGFPPLPSGVSWTYGYFNYFFQSNMMGGGSRLWTSDIWLGAPISGSIILNIDTTPIAGWYMFLSDLLLQVNPSLGQIGILSAIFYTTQGFNAFNSQWFFPVGGRQYEWNLSTGVVTDIGAL